MSGECDKCGEHTLDCKCCDNIFETTMQCLVVKRFIPEVSKTLTFRRPRLCNSEGEEMLCKCGNPAQAVIMGNESYVARCHDCMWMR
jgi:hypothetical protein